MLFDFVDEFAAEVQAGKITELDTVEESSPILAFCESFFDQLFAAQGVWGDGVQSPWEEGSIGARGAAARRPRKDGEDSRASKHARAVERLLSTYYDTLSRAEDDPDALPDFRRDLRAHRFGLFLNFRESFRLRDVLVSAYPLLFYPRPLSSTIVIGLGAWGLIWDGRGRREKGA